MSAYAAPVYNKPFYNPETKSYFELYSPEFDDPNRTMSVRVYGGIGFDAAMKMAVKRRFKGVRGRLAVVKTRETDEFVIKHLRPAGSAWIGLRYYCRFKKFMWITGEILRPGKDFSNWHPRGWRFDGSSPGGGTPSWCPNGRTSALPVHYWGSRHGFHWNANGFAKQFNMMIIEYRTGKP